MGGALFVGFREPDGAEHLLETWTNWMPWRTASLDFLRMGTSYRELLHLADHHKRGTITRRVKTISAVEYGVVLFDFKDRAIFSCNGYYTPGEYCFSPGIMSYDTTDEAVKDAQEVLTLVESGLLYSVRSLTGAFRTGDDDPTERAKLLAYCQKVLRQPPVLETAFEHPKFKLTSLPRDTGAASWFLRYKPLDMKVTALPDDRRLKGLTQNFIEEHGWESKLAKRFHQ